jgi:hypothetical protein
VVGKGFLADGTQKLVGGDFHLAWLTSWLGLHSEESTCSSRDSPDRWVVPKARR